MILVKVLYQGGGRASEFGESHAMIPASSIKIMVELFSLLIIFQF